MELAVGRGLAFLSSRDRTVWEVRGQLRKRGFEDRVIDGAVSRLAGMGYLDDRRFAERFVEDRRVLDGWGNSRIQRRLIQLGLDRATVDAVLDSDDPTLELSRAVELLSSRLKAPAEAMADRRRAMGLLMRRGYSLDTAADAVREHARLRA